LSSSGAPIGPALPPGESIELPEIGRLFVRRSNGPPGSPTVMLLHGWTVTAGRHSDPPEILASRLAAEKGIGARTEVGGALHPHRGSGLRIAVRGVVAQAIYDCPGGDGGVPRGGERSLDGGLFGPVSLV